MLSGQGLEPGFLVYSIRRREYKMKKKTLFTGILAVALVFGLVMGMTLAACDSATSGDPGYTPGGDNPGGDDNLPGGLSAYIDPALAGTSWKDNVGGSLLTLSFSSSSLTWGGTAGTPVNSTVSAQEAYSPVWVVKDGIISLKWNIPGTGEQTYDVYGYELSGGNLLLKSGGITFVTLVSD
jgi:hypothetical protein